VWTYQGATNPVCAEYVDPAHVTDGSSPTILIADDDPNAPRVVEVTFVPGSQPSLVWSYGTSYGTGPGQLEGPTDVERESDGSTLIADPASDRVIRVAPGAASPEWSYGVPGAAGADDGYLDGAMGACVESNGDVVIADTGNGRILEVNGADDVVWRSKQLVGTVPPALARPRVAERAAGLPPASISSDRVDGALLVCDQGAQNLALLGNTGGAQVDTAVFHLAAGASQAHLLSLRLDGSASDGTSVSGHFYLSDGDKRPFGLGVSSLRGSITQTIWFDVELNVPQQTDLWLTPTVKDIVLTYSTGETKAKTSGNGGATGGNGTASGAGTGTGSGVGGSGNGSAVGAGQGTSADLGGSGAAGNAGSTAQSGAKVVVPAGAQVATTGGQGSGGTITGVPVDVGDLSGGTHGGGGGSPPPRVSHLATGLCAAGAAAFIGCLLVCPSFVARRRLRRLAASQHKDVVEAWVVEASPKGDLESWRGRHGSRHRVSAAGRWTRRAT
jgi:hypothetical protein